MQSSCNSSMPQYNKGSSAHPIGRETLETQVGWESLGTSVMSRTPAQPTVKGGSWTDVACSSFFGNAMVQNQGPSEMNKTQECLGSKESASHAHKWIQHSFLVCEVSKPGQQVLDEIYHNNFAATINNWACPGALRRVKEAWMYGCMWRGAVGFCPMFKSST